MTYKYERIDYRVDDWTVETETHKESTIFQTPAWLEFLSKTQDGEIIVGACRRCVRKADKLRQQCLGRFNRSVAKDVD